MDYELFGNSPQTASIIRDIVLGGDDSPLAPTKSLIPRPRPEGLGVRDIDTQPALDEALANAVGENLRRSTLPEARQRVVDAVIPVATNLQQPVSTDWDRMVDVNTFLSTSQAIPTLPDSRTTGLTMSTQTATAPEMGSVDPVSAEGSTQGAGIEMVPANDQPAETPEEEIKPEEPQVQTYTVVSGDTLSRIASRYDGVSVEDIVSASGIDDPNKLAIGDVLTIPAPSATPAEEYVSVTPTPSLSGVATDYKTTAVALANDLIRDLGITQEEAAVIVGNLAQESGGFTSLQEINPLVQGSRGGYGYAQWTGPRRRAYESWARENNMSADSYEANYGYLIHELTNTDPAVQDLSMGIRSLDRIKGGNNIASMVRAFSGVSGQSSGFLMPSAAHANFAARTAKAREVLGFLREE